MVSTWSSASASRRFDGGARIVARLRRKPAAVPRREPLCPIVVDLLVSIHARSRQREVQQIGGEPPPVGLGRAREPTSRVGQEDHSLPTPSPGRAALGAVGAVGAAELSGLRGALAIRTSVPQQFTSDHFE